MKPKLYYTAPSDEIFEEVKVKAIEVWSKYDDEFNYRSEKTSYIAGLKNISDNVMTIVSMFDMENMRELALKLSVDSKQAISDRMVDGGQPSWANPFL